MYVDDAYCSLIWWLVVLDLEQEASCMVTPCLNSISRICKSWNAFAFYALANLHTDTDLDISTFIFFSYFYLCCQLVYLQMQA